MEIKPGDKYRENYWPMKPANKKIHIIAILEEMIVFKYWAGFRWWYKIEHPYYFKIRFDAGALKKIKKPSKSTKIPKNL